MDSWQRPPILQHSEADSLENIHDTLHEPLGLTGSLTQMAGTMDPLLFTQSIRKLIDRDHSAAPSPAGTAVTRDPYSATQSISDLLDRDHSAVASFAGAAEASDPYSATQSISDLLDRDHSAAASFAGAAVASDPYSATQSIRDLIDGYSSTAVSAASALVANAPYSLTQSISDLLDRNHSAAASISAAAVASNPYSATQSISDLLDRNHNADASISEAARASDLYSATQSIRDLIDGYSGTTESVASALVANDPDSFTQSIRELLERNNGAVAFDTGLTASTLRGTINELLAEYSSIAESINEESHEHWHTGPDAHSPPAKTTSLASESISADLTTPAQNTYPSHTFYNDSVGGNNELTQPGSGYDNLPVAPRVILLELMKMIIAGIISYYIAQALEHKDTAVKKVEQRITQTHADPRSIKKVACTSGSARELLHGHRLVIGDKLRLRSAPNMSAEVITLLPIGKIIELQEPPLGLEKDPGKSWIFISVIVGGDALQGWVARRYTTYFK